MTQTPSAPPTHAEVAFRPDPPAWPKVIGIVSIVLSSLGIGCTGCMGVWLAIMPSFMKGAEEKMGPMPSVIQPQPIALVFMAMGALWAFMQLAAGVTTVRRKPVGRPLHLVHALGALVLTTIGLYFQWQQQQAIQEWIRTNQGTQWAQALSGNKMGSIIGFAFGAALGYGWPVFCLIWFGLLKKRPEQGWIPPETDAI